jgi:hypothetical protein
LVKPNARIAYKDLESGTVTWEEFIDHGLEWFRDKKSGRWLLHISYGGEPLEWWLAENPRPRD